MRELHGPLVLTVIVGTDVHVCSWDPHQGWEMYQSVKCLMYTYKDMSSIPEIMRKLKSLHREGRDTKDSWGSLTSQPS